jgi:hypothetical protein
MRGLHVHGKLIGIHLYKHGLTRRYLNLGDDGRAYRCGRFKEIPFEDALSRVAEPLAEMGETLETPYDEDYRARWAAALRAVGCEELRIEIEPDEVAIH